MRTEHSQQQWRTHEDSIRKRIDMVGEDDGQGKYDASAVPALQAPDEESGVVTTPALQAPDCVGSILTRRTVLTKTEARLRHLKALRVLTSCTDVRLSLTEGISSVAQGVSAVDAGLNEVIVDDMTTPLGRVPYATLRGANIIALDGKLRK